MKIYLKKNRIYYIVINQYILCNIQKVDKAAVSYGIINNIDENNINYCFTEEDSSGSPIMNLLNNKIIGMHKEGSLNF